MERDFNVNGSTYKIALTQRITIHVKYLEKLLDKLDKEENLDFESRDQKISDIFKSFHKSVLAKHTNGMVKPEDEVLFAEKVYELMKEEWLNLLLKFNQSQMTKSPS